jgi:hypothetical protein
MKALIIALFELFFILILMANGHYKKRLIRPWLFVSVILWAGTKLAPMPF